MNLSVGLKPFYGYWKNEKNTFKPPVKHFIPLKLCLLFSVFETFLKPFTVYNRTSGLAYNTH